MEVLRRCWAWAYFGEDPVGIAPNIVAFAGEYVLAANNANSPSTPASAPAGTVALIGANSSDQVLLPSGATIPAGQSLTVLGTFTKSGPVPLVIVSGNQAIPANTSATYVVTKGSICAMTLAAPTVTTSDGVEITITSNTAFAHTLTATGLLQTGSASINQANFGAFAGCTIRLMAYQGKWNVISVNVVTFA